MRLKLFFLHTFLLLSVTLFAFDRAEYYAAANGKSGASLKTALFNIIKNPSVVSYDGLYEAYKKTDTRADGYVRDWYSKTTKYTHVSDKAGSYSKEGDCYNREHSVPQSWFSGTGLKSDIIHVLPTDGYVNNRRSNYPFGEVGSADYTSNGGYCKLGSCKTPGYSGTVFEPGDDIKGDIARIYFHMVTCYEDKATSWGHDVFSSSKYPGLEKWALDMFMRWSKNDPVDDVEKARNNAVEEVQGNRNPYVDFPGLEQYVWGTLKNTGVSVSNYVNPYEGDVPILENPEISFATTSVTLAAGDYFEQTVTTNSDGEVSYSSSDERVASVDSEGQVHALSTGKTIITASVSETSKYAAASASYTVYVTIDGDDPPMPTGNTYVKITTEPRDWTGTYLVVYENGNQAYVLDASRSTIDASGNYVVADIVQSEIAASTDVNDASLVVTGVVEGYTLRTSTGLYLTTEDGKKISAAQDSYSFLLSLDSDGAVIRPVKRSSVNLMYNSSWKGFRFYSSGQQPIQLYRRTEADHIDVIQNSKIKIANDNIYDLAGRRVTNPQKGLMYIVDGKVIVK